MDTVEKNGAPAGLLDTVSLLKIYLRLLFIQGLLNRKGMQNLGFANAIGTSRLARLEPELLKRHLGFFNCNPNFTIYRNRLITSYLVLPVCFCGRILLTLSRIIYMR